jgi:2-oxoisovalerate dehydrogenase E1 component
VPFNYDLVLESVRKTGRVVLASDACARGSYLRDLASNITEMAFDDLDAPPVVVGSRNWITPAYEMEEYFFPQPSWIVDAIHERILPLKGHQVSTDWSLEQQLKRSREGV